ncbi:hypothetical protein EMIT0373P_11224 [Pseudomonas chlororaphis]
MLARLGQLVRERTADAFAGSGDKESTSFHCDAPNTRQHPGLGEGTGS